MTDEQRALMAMEGECQMDMFKGKEIRRMFHGKEWWFSVKDVLESLVETTDGTRYMSDLRSRDPGLNERYSEITMTLDFASGSGKQKTNFVNLEGIFRIMQSVPSKKAEPFKKWLAKVGYERIQEIQDPEIAIKRAMGIYRAKGYDDDWIDARIRNVTSRKKLTDEWDQRGVPGDKIGILSDAISIQAFAISVAKHKEIKGLKGQSLRDNMTPIELTLTTLGEQASREISKMKNAQGFYENLDAAKKGGKIAGDARIQIEAETGKAVVSPKNYLTARQRANNAKELPEAFDSAMQQLINTPPITNEEIEKSRKAA